MITDGTRIRLRYQTELWDPDTKTAIVADAGREYIAVDHVDSTERGSHLNVCQVDAYDDPDMSEHILVISDLEAVEEVVVTPGVPRGGRYTFERRFYNNGDPVEPPQRYTWLLSARTRGSAKAFHCNVCGQVIPPMTPHLTDDNGSVTRFHPDCVTEVS